MLDVDLLEKSYQSLIVLDGNLTIETISQIKEKIVNALSSVQALSIDLEKIEKLDVAGIQLLCACHRFATGKGKRLYLSGVQRRHSESLRLVGFVKNYACPSSKSSEPCLWVCDSLERR